MSPRSLFISVLLAMAAGASLSVFSPAGLKLFALLMAPSAACAAGILILRLLAPERHPDAVMEPSLG